MSRLRHFLTTKRAVCQKTGRPAGMKLGSGLHFEFETPDRLVLWRADCAPGVDEPGICARELGWPLGGYDPTWVDGPHGHRQAIVTRVAVPLAEENLEGELVFANLPLLPPVGQEYCGSCDRWHRTDAYLGECDLGWEGHDPLIRHARFGDRVHFLHSTPRPLTSYHAHCMALPVNGASQWRLAR